MIRRALLAWLAVPLLGGVLLAGCGGSSTSTSQSTSTPAATTPAATTNSGSTGTTTPSGVSAAATQQAIETCKKEVRTTTTLPASSKTKLEGVCEKAANGNTPEVRKAIKDICEEAVNKASLPQAAKEQGLAACRIQTK
jgi:hypothetical protein